DKLELKTGLTSVNCQPSASTNLRKRSRLDRAGRPSGARLDAGVFSFLERTRIAARPVPRTGAMADLHRSRVARSSDMVYDPQLWVQRRRRDFYFHLWLYCGVRLRPRDAQVWLCGCVGAHSEAGLADLYGTCAAVRDPCRGSVLRHDQPRETVLCERNGDSGFPQAARRKPDTGAAAEIPSIEYGR